MNAPFDVLRDAFGALVLVEPDGTRHGGVRPVRAFPIAAPDEGISFVGSHGREVRWLDRLGDLAPHAVALVNDALALRDFAPVIERIVAVSGYGVPSTWAVETDRGAARLVLKAEEDIRRLADGALLITDGSGLQFRVRDRFALDRASRRILERFL